MKHKGTCLVLLLLMVLLAGCQKEEQETEGYRIYCVNTEGTRLESESYTPVAEGGDELIQELIGQLGKTPAFPEHRKAVPDGIGITATVCTEKNLRVDFNGTYHEMDHITEVFCRAAVVKTLVQVPEVDTVEITVNGQELADSQGNPIGVMGDHTFIDNKGKGINSYQCETFVLYFADKNGQKLSKEMRTVRYSSNYAKERVLLEELFKGPDNKELQAVFPENTKALDVMTEDKLCTVNMGAVFNQPPGTSVLPETTIYALVNTLCDNCGIDQVQIAIEGDSTVKYLETIDISKPFERNSKIIYPAEETQGAGKDKTPGVGVDPALQE